VPHRWTAKVFQVAREQLVCIYLKSDKTKINDLSVSVRTKVHLKSIGETGLCHTGIIKSVAF